MGKSARPKGATKAEECIKCHRLTRRMCSSGECDTCNHEKFMKEFKPTK